MVEVTILVLFGENNLPLIWLPQISWQMELLCPWSCSLAPNPLSLFFLLQNLSQTPVLRELLKEAKMPDTTVKIESPELSMVYKLQPP